MEKSQEDLGLKNFEEIDPLLFAVNYKLDCNLGCSINCRYCIARYHALMRREIRSKYEWTLMREIPIPDLSRFEGNLIEFPIRHDITRSNLSTYLHWFIFLLEKNRVLVTSKPRIKIIEEIVRNSTIEKTIFRLTITSRHDEVLKYWEPGGSTYEERLAVLKYLHDLGYETHVNIEPILDANPQEICEACLPFVSGNIVLGKMLGSEEKNLQFDYLEIYDKCKSLSDKILFRKSVTNLIDGRTGCNCKMYGIRRIL